MTFDIDMQQETLPVANETESNISDGKKWSRDQNSKRQFQIFELKSCRLMNRATQSNEGDNPFILELRGLDKIKDENTVQNLKRQIPIKPLQIFKETLRMKKSGEKKSSFEIFEILHKVHKNTNQNQGDTGKLWGGDKWSYKHFGNFKDLLDSIPKRTIKTLSQWTQKHQIFLESSLPKGADPNKYFFDAQSSEFHGPFAHSDGRLRIEQQNPAKPRFIIMWNPSEPSYFSVYFLTPYCKSPKSFLVINSQYVNITDRASNKTLHHYKLNSDGSLGDKAY